METVPSMATAAEALASPLTIKVGDKTYTLTRLTDGDYREWETWMQDEYIRRVKRNTADYPEARQDKLLAQAYMDAAKITLTSAYAIQKLMSLDGLFRLIKCSLRVHHPEITDEEIFNICSDEKAIEEFMPSIEFLNGLDKQSDKQDDPEKKVNSPTTP